MPKRTNLEQEEEETWELNSTINEPESEKGRQSPLFNPFGSSHRHITYTDCPRIENQINWVYPNLKEANSDLTQLTHDPRATLVTPHDLIQALERYGYEVKAYQSAARRRTAYECNHDDKHVVLSLIQGECICLACIDDESAREKRYITANIKYTPLGVKPSYLPRLPSIAENQ